MIPVLILLATWGIESREDQVLWTPYYKANYALGEGGVGVQPESVDCPEGEQWVAGADVPEPVSDDRPFPYLEAPSIPTFYVVALSLNLLASVVLVRAVGGPMGASVDLERLEGRSRRRCWRSWCRGAYACRASR